MNNSKNRGKIEKGELLPYKYIIKEIQNPVFFVNNINIDDNNTANQGEDEVLFLPHSCFLVDDITSDENDELIKIIYLKYLDSFQIKIEKKNKRIGIHRRRPKRIRKYFVK